MQTREDAICKLVRRSIRRHFDDGDLKALKNMREVYKTKSPAVSDDVHQQLKSEINTAINVSWDNFVGVGTFTLVT